MTWCKTSIFPMVWKFSSGNELTLLMLQPEYSKTTRSILLLLIPWLIAWAGHPEPWWFDEMGMLLFSLRMSLDYLQCFTLTERCKNGDTFSIFPKKNSLANGLSLTMIPDSTLTLGTHSVFQRTLARMNWEALAPVTHPGLAMVTNGTLRQKDIFMA